jgi:tRNA pseudouridine13 synthase
MKLKQQPEDFQVEELTDVMPGAGGSFAFYRLEKRGLGTPEAVQAICRRWKVELRRVSYGGLKDRHAVTRQYLTIQRGPRRGLKQEHLHLHYLGQVEAPFTPDRVRANRFQLVLRALDGSACTAAERALGEVHRDGVPNYFDDQRFGSVGAGRQFIARRLIGGDYEGALKLALAEPYEFDRAAQKAEKRILREHWGDWAAAKAQLPRGHARSLITYLADHPDDFRDAVARLRKDLLSLYLSAYQSHLWNQLLARWLEAHCRPEQLLRVELRLGPVPMCRHLDEDQRRAFHAQLLPLPSARLKFAADDPLKPLLDAVLRAEGLTLEQIKLKHFREPFFSKGDRPAFCIPADLSCTSGPDELNPGRRKLTLAFELPRGCYATMLVKRITAAER